MTVHRDALAAAQARIAALEAALEDARGGAPSEDALRSEVARLEMLLSAAHAEKRVAEERAEAAELELGKVRAERAKDERDTKKREREQAKAEVRAARAEPPRDLRSMHALDRHNASFPAVTTGKDAVPAGVLCPACVERGERVELFGGHINQVVGGASFLQVICPRCGLVGAKRTQ